MCEYFAKTTQEENKFDAMTMVCEYIVLYVTVCVYIALPFLLKRILLNVDGNVCFKLVLLVPLLY